MPNFTAGTSFTDGVTNDVTAAKLNALVADAVPTSNLALTSTNGTIANFTSSTANITLGTIPTLTAGTTTGTAGIFTSGTITTGLIPTLTTGTTTSTNEVVTNGTITNLSATTSTFLGTITGSTNVVNIGSGQIYKDASGNVGIGTTSPTAIGSGATLDLRATSGAGIGFGSTSAGQFAQMYVLNADSSLRIQNTSASGFTSFTTNNIERLRIDSSGNLLVGKTSPSTSTVGFQFDLANNKIACGANGSSTALFNRNGDDGAVVQIARDGSQIGTISATTTAVAYNTSSDYRLKTNLEPISNGIERVKQLPVYRFNWIADQSGNKVDGFVAHEAQAIVPECVTGEKDAVDADGKPVHQGIDQSKIVPLLTAALKEAIAKIETLEAKVTALEAA